MNDKLIIDALKQEASINPTANAVLHVFAMRQRARQNVTLRALAKKMENEGFNFSFAEYAKFLRKLATLGVGKLEMDDKGRVIALKEIKLTLQSMGQAALGLEPLRLIKYNARNKFVKVKTDITNDVKPMPPTKPVKSTSIEYPTSLTIHIGGKPVNFRVPTNLTASEIRALVSVFHDRAMADDTVEYPVSMTTVIQGHPVSLQVPKNITSEEIAALVMKFHAKEIL